MQDSNNKQTQDSTDNTILDDVFRTMVQKMPSLIIPVINEVFGTEYNLADDIQQLRNEHFEFSGKIVTDFIFVIKNKRYHIECQSTDDKTMTIRMIEYDFTSALHSTEKAKDDDIMCELNFHQLCIIYIKNDSNAPKYLPIKVILPDGKNFIYKCKTFKISDYTSDVIFQKKLLLFLPYYILRYQTMDIGKDSNNSTALLTDIIEIRQKLELLANTEEQLELFTNLCELITRISDHIFKNSYDVNNRLKDIMCGKY